MLFISKAQAYNLSDRDNIRLERLQACQQAFEERKEIINFTYEYDINKLILNCATRMH
jgi:hypothetical protein